MLSLSVFLALIDNEDDRARFAAFYEKYKDYSLKLAISFLHDLTNAEDAVQDTFEYLAEHPWRILDYKEKSAKWFLAELVRDFSNNILRKESSIQKISLDTTTQEALSEAAFLEAMEQAYTEDIKEAVLALSETDQSIVRLFYNYNYKTKEIAEILKLSDANVRKRLQRARAQLRESLESSKEEVYE